MIDISGIKVVHPCDLFARQAGHASWLAALESMKAGAILTAQDPSVGKTTVGLGMFMSQVKAEGLTVISFEDDPLGRISVGLCGIHPTNVAESVVQPSQVRH